MRHVLVPGAINEIGGEVAARLTNHNIFAFAVCHTEALDGVAGRLINVGAVAVRHIYFNVDGIAAHRRLVEHAW